MTSIDFILTGKYYPGMRIKKELTEAPHHTLMIRFAEHDSPTLLELAQLRDDGWLLVHVAPRDDGNGMLWTYRRPVATRPSLADRLRTHMRRLWQKF